MRPRSSRQPSPPARRPQLRTTGMQRSIDTLRPSAASYILHQHASALASSDVTDDGSDDGLDRNWGG